MKTFVFSSAVKAITPEHQAQYDTLPELISANQYTLPDKIIISQLYSRYVEPIKPIAETYMKNSEPYIGTNKRPNAHQAKHTCLRWLVYFLNMGEMDNETAAKFFWSELNSTPIRQDFIRAVWTEIKTK